MVIVKKREGRVGGKRARQESEGEVGKKVRKESVSEKVRKESETTLKTVQDKVNRSMGLLQSLGIEKDRWGLTSNKLKLQMTTLISDIFLSSAFLSYGGYFNQQHRNSLLLTTWAHHLETAAIAFRTDPNEWLNWQTKSLPSDDLCTENAIDLSGQATELIFDYRDQTSATEFILFEYTYNSELLLIRAGIEVNPGPTFEMKKIQDAAEKIWKHAGQVVDIPAEQHYTYEGITELDPSVTTQLVNILKEDLGVSFQLKHYQNVTISSHGQVERRHRDQSPWKWKVSRYLRRRLPAQEAPQQACRCRAAPRALQQHHRGQGQESLATDWLHHDGRENWYGRSCG